MASASVQRFHWASCEFFSRLEADLFRFAENEFGLDVVENGSKVRSHLIQAERSGRYQEALHPKPPPYQLLHVWQWWNELATARAYDGFSGLPQPVDYEKVVWWSIATRQPVHSWEVALIIKLDAKYRAITAPKPKG